MRKNKDLFSIFPADAGVNLPWAPSASRILDIPRGCGGEPQEESQPKTVTLYSPRMRG